MAVLPAGDIGAEKSGSAGIVQVGQYFGFDIVGGARCEHVFELALGQIGTLANVIVKVTQALSCARFDGDRGGAAANLVISAVGKTEDKLPETFFDRLLTGE